MVWHIAIDKGSRKRVERETARRLADDNVKLEAELSNGQFIKRPNIFPGMEPNAAADPPAQRNAPIPQRSDGRGGTLQRGSTHPHIRNPPPRPGAVPISRHNMANYHCRNGPNGPNFQFPVRYVSQPGRPTSASTPQAQQRRPPQQNGMPARFARGGYPANNHRARGTNQAARGTAVRRGTAHIPTPSGQRRQIDHSDPRLSAVPIGRTAATPAWSGQLPVKRVEPEPEPMQAAEENYEEMLDEEEEDPINMGNDLVPTTHEEQLALPPSPSPQPALLSTLSTSNEDIFKQLEDLRLQPVSTISMEADLLGEDPEAPAAAFEVILEDARIEELLAEPMEPPSTIDLIISEVARPRPLPEFLTSPATATKPAALKEPKQEPVAPQEETNPGPPPLPASIAQKKKTGRPKGSGNLPKKEKPVKPRKNAKKAAEAIVTVETPLLPAEESLNLWLKQMAGVTPDIDLQRLLLAQAEEPVDRERQQQEAIARLREDKKVQEMILKLEQDRVLAEALAASHETANRRRKLLSETQMDEEDDGEQDPKRFKMEHEEQVPEAENDITIDADDADEDDMVNPLETVSHISCRDWGEKQWEAVSSLLDNSFATGKPEPNNSYGLGNAVNASFIHEVPETPMKTVDEIGKYFERTFDKITITFYPQQIFYGELELDITHASTISFVLDSARPRIELKLAENISDSFSMTVVNKFTMVPPLIRGFPPCLILGSSGLDDQMVRLSEKFRKYKEETTSTGVTPYQCHPNPLFFVLNSNPLHSESQCTVEIKAEGQEESYRITAAAGFEVMDSHVQLNLAIHPKLSKMRFFFSFLLDDQFWDYVIHLRLLWIFLVSKNGKGRWIAKCREDLEMLCDSNFVEMHVETGNGYSLYPPTHRFRPLQRKSYGSLDDGFECREPFPLRFKQAQKQKQQVQSSETVETVPEQVQQVEEEKVEEVVQVMEVERQPTPEPPKPSVVEQIKGGHFNVPNGKRRPNNTAYGSYADYMAAKNQKMNMTVNVNTMDFLQNLPDPTTLGYDGSGPSTSSGPLYYPHSPSFSNRYGVSSAGYDGSSSSVPPAQLPRPSRLIYRIPKPFPPLEINEPKNQVNGKRVKPEPNTGYFYNHAPAETPPSPKRVRKDNGVEINGNGHAGESSQPTANGNNDQYGEDSGEDALFGNLPNGYN
uniref:CKK domain-containing protein n=1 Tax=Caenorhabditis tropicalis TaxID=1561998 RepID=A0A1I7T1Z5_9PELO